MVTECGMNRTMSWLFFAFPPPLRWLLPVEDDFQ